MQAQRFGNEWIRFDQQYFKIPVTQKGIYRITASDLQAAGFPVAAVDPRRIQLYHRGFEQAGKAMTEPRIRFYTFPVRHNRISITACIQIQQLIFSPGD